MNLFPKILTCFVVVFILCLLFYFKISQTPNYAPINILSEERDEINKAILKELKKRNIPYRIDKNGVVHYPEKEKEDVKKIVENAITHISGWDKAKVSISDKKLKKIFLAMLDENNIPYWIKRQKEDNTEWICWDDKYDEQIKISQAEAFKKSYGLKKPPLLSFNNHDEFKSCEEMLRKEKIEYRVIDCEHSDIPCIEYEWKDHIKVDDIIAKIAKGFS